RCLARAVEGDTRSPRAPQKHGAVRSVKRKRLFPSRHSAALGIFLRERFGIFRKHPRCALLRREANAREQRQPLAASLLISGVIVSVPSRGNPFRQTFVQQLLQDFLPAKLAYGVSLEL